MSVWLTIPSARPPEDVIPVLEQWKKQGYKIALWRDDNSWRDVLDYCNFLTVGKYPGYAQAVNTLILTIASENTSAEWFVIGGDDTLPDPNKTAEEIATECNIYFGYKHGYAAKCGVAQGEPVADTYQRCYGDFQEAWKENQTFGVLQPTGDVFAGRQIERICGSPWIGREFALRVNQGKGPLWPEYKHMFVDEEIMEVAKKYGVLWQRRDLTHHHNHWTRNGDQADYSKPLPAFLREANSPEHWKKYGDLFRERKRNGFPGSELLSVVTA
jgi:hypothetical protein